MRFKSFQLIFVTVLAIIDITVAMSYKKKCKNGGVIIESGVFDFQRKDIVDRHNLVRRQVAKGRLPGQPTGSNLLIMTWDKMLEKEARLYAEQCESNLYELCPRSELRFNVGVNIYVQPASRFNKAANWIQVMNAWYNEHSHYNFYEMQHNNYSQMVWAKTYMIGCAYTYYFPAKGKDHIKIYLCLYGPGGNHKGVTAYRPGSGCPNLCHIEMPEKDSTVKVSVGELLFIQKTPGKYRKLVKNKF